MIRSHPELGRQDRQRHRHRQGDIKEERKKEQDKEEPSDLVIPIAKPVTVFPASTAQHCRHLRQTHRHPPPDTLTFTVTFLISIGLPAFDRRTIAHRHTDRRVVQKTKLARGTPPCKHLVPHNGPCDAPQVLSLGHRQTSQYDPSPQRSAALLEASSLEPRRPLQGQATASREIAATILKDQV